MKRIRKILLNPSTLIALLLGLIFLIIGGQEYIKIYLYNYNHCGNYLQKYIGSAYAGSKTLMAVLFPSLCCIPFSLNFRNEIDCGIAYIAMSKSNYHDYLKKHILDTIISGFLVIFIPCIIWFLSCYFILGNGNIAGDFINCNINYKDLYTNYPFIYGIFLILNSSLQGSVFALFGMGFSVIFKNKYIAIILPFAYCVVSASIFGAFSNYFNAIDLFYFNAYSKNGIIGQCFIFLYDLLLIIVSLLMINKGEYNGTFE